ncbi:(2Fe-2S)-binding protein [Lysobacter sp. BMK333-48F3]|uniref:2Fe-2S iron-sulfur cluster-binding protein n=1 Tax=Lysobacter sp. BMK333-48F3 TaxID=2867962 RepID=UPI001C8B7D83|nr:2Fe-2S iron-sulfur cluster-binding protein [Lysobacter sp. BMK333-48F3]MBX9400461.1 (2Fe-2S)-binding protein [Lysobacter sp. BMK333-48F3]
MSAPLRLWINEVAVEVPAGANVAAAVARAGAHFRRSCGGQPRAPLCGMGVCFECRVEIDGVAHRRACLTLARDGMRVRCDD